MSRGLRRVREVFAVASLLCLAALVAAPTAVGAPDGKTVRAISVDRSPVEGAFGSLTATALEIAGVSPSVAVDGLRELRFASDAEPAPSAGKGVPLRVVLRGDETVRGVFLAGDADGIQVRPADLPSLRLPFESIRCIEADPPTRGVCDEPSREHPARDKVDVAYTRTGDSFPGTVTGASEKGLTVLGGDKKEATVAWDDLVVAHLNVDPVPPASGLTAEVETLGGSRLVATAVTGDAAGLKVVTRSGIEVTAPLASLRVIRWTGGRFVYVSDLPYKSKWTPYYFSDEITAGETTWFAARSDRTPPPEGCPLRVAGTTYRHGIAVHSRSEVTVALAKAYASFETKFGIDDQALTASEGPKGDVTARVLVDGKPVWTSGGSVKGGEPARAIGPIDVKGADTLVLEVDFGGGQHVMDRGDWVDAILVR